MFRRYVKERQSGQSDHHKLGMLYSSGAFVTAISVDVGSGFSSNYHAFANEVTFATNEGATKVTLKSQAL